MRITEEMIDYIAALSRIELTKEERAEVAQGLGNIVEYMDVLATLDTEGVEPTSHILSLKNVFREDIVQPSMERDELIANAPLKEDGCFVVPKTVE